MYKRWHKFAVLLLIVGAGPAWVGVSGAVSLTSDWRTASRESAGVAPDPALTTAPVVQVYAARAFNWRGVFAVHTWIAVKTQGADAYTVYQVLGWNEWRGLSVVDIRSDLPDRRWYDAEPEVLADIRGAPAAALVEPIEQAVQRYPYSREYRLWPGPNSNTFVAFVAREVPALKLHLPVTAIGKDFLTDRAMFGRAPSGSGAQVSLFGALGVLLARDEGLEINVLGLVFGLDVLRPALKLPGIGRVGWPRQVRQTPQ